MKVYPEALQDPFTDPQASSAQPQEHQLHLECTPVDRGQERLNPLDWTLSFPSPQNQEDPDLEPRPPGGGLFSSSPWRRLCSQDCCAEPVLLGVMFLGSEYPYLT